MYENIEIINILNNDLLNHVLRFKEQGYRLIQICCTKLKDGLTLDYSFGLEYKFENLRMTIEENEEVASITSIFSPAFLYENEMHDLFGVNISVISIDYKGNLYRTAVKRPFNCENEKVEE